MTEATLIINRTRPVCTLARRRGRRWTADSMPDRRSHSSRRPRVALFFIAYSLYVDVSESGMHSTSWLPFVLLGVALFIALGFEFVNGFHDTANAVATVIYTHSMPAHVAVVWSGVFNFLGVLASSGAVAYGIIALLPVELILQVGSGAGFAMVFALLIGAIIWNLGTWYLGLPASSSHTLIGSIIGVGLANQMMAATRRPAASIGRRRRRSATRCCCRRSSGSARPRCCCWRSSWSPAIPSSTASRKATAPPPWWIRSMLILTCTGVSFAHGSNDGQKGMGLIMLILIGVVPTAYALNRAMPDSAMSAVHPAHPLHVAQMLERCGGRPHVSAIPAASSATTCGPHAVNAGTWCRALAQLLDGHRDAGRAVRLARRLPQETVQNVRNDMYLASETIRSHRRIRQLHIRRKADADLLKPYQEPSSTARPASSRSGSRLRSRSRSASARWSAGSASWSPSARKSARAI